MLLGVVATLGITGEFAHGTIRPTFAGLPDRWRPLLAKPVVDVALAAAITVLIVVVSWSAGAAMAEGDRSLSEHGVRSALFGVILLAVGSTMLGYGLGLLVRNSPAAICILLLWPLVAELLIAGLVSAAGAEQVQRHLPYLAGINLASSNPDPDLLGRFAGGLYFFAWVAVIVGLGLLSARRRDA